MHIGFATQDPYSHYWMILSRAARERAAELDIDITIQPAKRIEHQIEIIHRLVSQRVDALIVGPVAAVGLAGPLGRAQAAGIPVIVAAAQVSDCTVTSTVRSDHSAGAELAAAYVAEQIGGAGPVAHLVGPSILQDNIDRAAGVRNVFGRHPGIEIAFERESPDWAPASGAALMRAAIAQCPGLRGVCVANDTLALGAASAIAEAGRTGQIMITGFDATPDALIAISQGRLSASVQQSMRTIGQTAVDLARSAAGGAPVPPLVLTDIRLVTPDNLLDATLDSLAILPGVLNDAIERGEALAQARDEIIQAQQVALRELSTPLIPLADDLVVMPLIGSIDSTRAQQVMETLLSGVADTHARTAIIDITGVMLVDTQVASTLTRAAQAVKLLGANVVLTGIRPEVAQTLVGLGVNLGEIITRSTLQSGIAYALRAR